MSEPTIALVTGANRGIGLEVARELAAEGRDVILTARDEARATEAADGLEGDVTPMALDVASAESIAGLAERLERLDVLIHNAAGYVDWAETATAADLDATRALFEVNLFGP
jgi:NAD(P)-dependent dehydrogenase (short-subunit alcohol dehydrogenase family)